MYFLLECPAHVHAWILVGPCIPPPDLTRLHFAASPRTLVPLCQATCSKTGRKYLLCDYNRDGDSYRSPWYVPHFTTAYKVAPAKPDEQGGGPCQRKSTHLHQGRRQLILSQQHLALSPHAHRHPHTHLSLFPRANRSNEYEPALEDGFQPSDALRSMEVDANTLYDSYREQYYEGGVSSVYLWDLDTGFAGCFLVKKTVQGNAFVTDGGWDSIHVVEVTEKGDGKATYKLTSTLMLTMGVQKASVGDSNLSGCMTKQKELTLPVRAVKCRVVSCLVVSCVVSCRVPHVACVPCAKSGE